MIKTTERFKAAVIQNNRKWRLMIQVNPDTGNKETLKNKDIIMGSFTYDESSICSDNLDIGATYASLVFPSVRMVKALMFAQLR